MSSKNDYSEILKKVSFFSDIVTIEGAIEKVSLIMEKKTFLKGESITKQGSPGSEFFVLLSGKLSVHKTTIDGEDFNVAYLDSSSYPSFGEGGLIENEVRSASILCEMNSDCLVLNKENFDALCIINPHIGLPLFKKIAQSLIKRLAQTSNDLMLLHKALMDEIRAQ